MKHLLTLPREPVNAWTHWAGVVISLITLWPLLYWAKSRSLPLWPFTVFIASMVGLYLASASYHSFKLSTKGLTWLRKLDHACIFVLIAGTYTPVAYYGLEGIWQTTVLWAVWSIAGVGVALKLLTLNSPRWLNTAMYLSMGWMALSFIPQLAHNLPAASVYWLAIGGIFYSIGAIIYGTQRWNPRPGFGFHEIWHLFVLAGTVAHIVMTFHLRP